MISNILLQIKLDVSSVSSDIYLSQHYQRKVTIQKDKLFSARLVLCSNLTGKIPFLLWAVAIASCMVSLKTCQTHSDVHSIKFYLNVIFMLFSLSPKVSNVFRQDFKKWVFKKQKLSWMQSFNIRKLQKFLKQKTWSTANYAEIQYLHSASLCRRACSRGAVSLLEKTVVFSWWQPLR